MTDPKDQQPYLLDDDDFAKLMEASYQEAGQPVDAIRARKVWTQLEAQTEGGAPPSTRGRKGQKALMLGALLGAAAALLLLVRVQPTDTALDLPVKGLGKGDYSAIWAHPGTLEEKFSIPLAVVSDYRLRIKTNQAMTFSIYASSDEDTVPKRLAGPFSPTAAGQQDIAVSPEQLGPMNRICIVGAENATAYEKTVAMLDTVWQMLSAPQCVHVEP